MSYGDPVNVILNLNIPADEADMPRILYYLSLANKKIESWKGTPGFSELSDDLLNVIAELYATYYYKLSSGTYTVEMPRDLESWRREAEEFIRLKINTAQKPHTVKFSEE